MTRIVAKDVNELHFPKPQVTLHAGFQNTWGAGGNDRWGGDMSARMKRPPLDTFTFDGIGDIGVVVRNPTSVVRSTAPAPPPAVARPPQPYQTVRTPVRRAHSAGEDRAMAEARRARAEAISRQQQQQLRQQQSRDRIRQFSTPLEREKMRQLYRSANQGDPKAVAQLRSAMKAISQRSSQWRIPPQGVTVYGLDGKF